LNWRSKKSQNVTTGWAVISATKVLYLKIYSFDGIMGFWIDNNHVTLCKASYLMSSYQQGKVSEIHVWVFGALPFVGVTIRYKCFQNYTLCFRAETRNEMKPIQTQYDL
jgi:hypothetical protein